MEKKAIEWRWDMGVYMPFCPHCNEPAYERDSCIFCEKEYEWVDGEYQPTEVVVGEYTVCQSTSKDIYLYKGDDFVMHCSCTKELTEEELVEMVDHYEKLIKKRECKDG